MKIIGAVQKLEDYSARQQDLVRQAFAAHGCACHVFIFGSFYPDGMWLLTKYWSISHSDSGGETWRDDQRLHCLTI